MTDQSPNLSAVQLAKRFGITKVAIGNYVKRGMPVVEGSDPRRFDLVACDAWLAANRDHEGQFANSSPGKGGKREGSGRPKGSGKTGGVIESETGAAHSVKIAVTTEDLLNLVRAGITPSEISASASALKLLKEVTEYEKESGLLVNAEEAADALRTWCVDIRERMLQVAPRVAAKAGELGLSQADAVRLRTVVEEVVGNVLATLREEAMEDA